MNTITFFSGTALLSLNLLCTSVYAQDMVKIAPHNTKVLFENDRVRVLETLTKPGEKLPMHSHLPRVNYFLNPLKERITYEGKQPQDFSWKAGEVAFSEAVKLEVVNIGTTEGHNIVVELKGGQGNAVHRN
ncbi:MAG: cytoplasmic protein [Betaproteobacteria bacterium]|nr:cytoplasmic protein [Betaproteobacteria bacterium]